MKEKTFKGTPGLYELVFMRRQKVNSYTQDDLHNYKALLNETNAHIRDYSESVQILGNRGWKYTNILSKLFDYIGSGKVDKLFKHIGSGIADNFGQSLMQVTNKQIDYIYWDVPNKLVDRLRLLVPSQQAGHSNHINEIISIIEELREADIIE